MNSRDRINQRRGYIALSNLLLLLGLGGFICWVILAETLAIHTY